MELCESYWPSELVKAKFVVLEIECRAVRRELVNWMEGDLSPELRARIDRHLQSCSHCLAIYDGARNIVRLLGNERAIELPHGFSQRLYDQLFRFVK